MPYVVTASRTEHHAALFSVSFAGLWGQDRLTLEQSIDLTAELGRPAAFTTAAAAAGAIS